MLRLSTLILLFLSFQTLGQKFADKNFYLVDSLEYDKVSAEYQYLIDNNLKWYHAAKTDVERVSYVNQIVKLCWDENVWPKYNQWVYEYTGAKLKEPQSDTVRFQLLQALAGSIYYIGWNYGVQANYNTCIFYYEQCTKIYLEIGDSIGVANSLDNIGGIYLIKGESAKALDYFTRALEIREKIGDKLGTGASRNSIGSIYMEQGDYIAALNEFELALKLHEEVKFTSGISSALNNLGNIQSYFGNYAVALAYFERSFDLKNQLEDKQGKAHSLTQMGTISMYLGDYETAQKYFNESLLLYQEVSDQRGIAGFYANTGVLYKIQGKYKKALHYFNECLSLAQKTGAVKEKKNALESLFQTYILQDNLEGAEKAILEIIALNLYDVKVNFVILPEQKKELYFSTMSQDFMNLYAFANLRKHENPVITEIAYNNTLKLKGLLLKSTTAMREAILTSGDAALIEKYTRWINLKKEIANQYAIGGETESIEISANEIEKDLIKSSSSFSAFNSSDDFTWKTIQAKLKPGEAAIEYIHFNDSIGTNQSPTRYAALIVTEKCEHPIMISLCTSKDLEAILGNSQTNNLNYIQKIYGTKQNPNHELYKLIWQPLENEVLRFSTVYFSATGLLHKISFASLSNEYNEFLCDNYNLVQVSSTAQLASSERFEFSANSTASLFGGVKYSTEKTKRVIWNYLPGSLAEIDSIYPKLKTQINVNYFSNENASEENFKEVVSKSNFIHIATHGFFYPDPDLIQKEIYKEESNEDIDFRGGGASYGIWNFVNNKNPLMRSGLALAGSNDMWDRNIYEEGEDGVLTAQEVTTLNLRNTDLVVLSACETGLGDIRGNEGVYGLQRAFKMAGVHYLIMSLWQVPDEETAEFMIVFYTKLLIQKDIRQAFSDTQKEMRAKYDPYYWAAFVLIE
jgi:CHAT domain-containing protein/Tfp pilus assembly protein PilF